MTIGHRRAGRLGGQLRDAVEAVAGEDGVDHPQSATARRRSTQASGRSSWGGPPVVHRRASTHRERRSPASGWAWSVSSPDSPVRIR